MRPASFTYTRPPNLAAALGALAAGAIPLAGGQSLLQAMRLREIEPAALFELADIAELDNTIVIRDGTLTIGALVTHRELACDASIERHLPWLVQAAQALGDVQVRNRGTVLGNVCWADPRANMAVALLASAAQVVAVDTQGRVERIALDAFFTGFRTQALGARLATALEIPLRDAARGCYLEFSRQRQDLALINVCTVSHSGGTRIAIGGIDPTPVRLTAVEAHAGDVFEAGLSAALAAELVPARHQPIADQHGSRDYKLSLASTLVTRALAHTKAGS